MRRKSHRTFSTSSILTEEVSPCMMSDKSTWCFWKVRRLAIGKRQSRQVVKWRRCCFRNQSLSNCVCFLAKSCACDDWNLSSLSLANPHSISWSSCSDTIDRFDLFDGFKLSSFAAFSTRCIVILKCGTSRLHATSVHSASWCWLMSVCSMCYTRSYFFHLLVRRVYCMLV